MATAKRPPLPSRGPSAVSLQPTPTPTRTATAATAAAGARRPPLPARSITSPALVSVASTPSPTLPPRGAGKGRSADDLLDAIEAVEADARMLRTLEFRLQTTRRQFQALLVSGEGDDKRLREQEREESTKVERLRAAAALYDTLVDQLLLQENPAGFKALETLSVRTEQQRADFDKLVPQLERLVNQMQRSLSSYQHAMLIEREMITAKRKMTIENPTEALKRDDQRRRALAFAESGTEQAKLYVRTIPPKLAEYNPELAAKIEQVPQVRYQSTDYGHDIATDAFGLVAYVFHDKGKQERLKSNNSSALAQTHAIFMDNVKSLQQYILQLRQMSNELASGGGSQQVNTTAEKTRLLEQVRKSRGRLAPSPSSSSSSSFLSDPPAYENPFDE